MTNENKTELKPCPFCDSKNISHDSRFMTDVECVSCGITAPDVDTWNARPNASEGGEASASAPNGLDVEARIKEAVEMINKEFDDYNYYSCHPPISWRHHLKQLTKIKTLLEG